MKKIKKIVCALLCMLLVLAMGGAYSNTLFAADSDSGVETVKVTYTFETSVHGTISFEKEYKVGDALELPTSYDYEYKDEEGQEGVNLVRFKFTAEWLNSNEEVVTQTQEVTEDMELHIIKFSSRELKLCYYVLNRDIKQPEEFGSYPKPNYSAGIEIRGAVKHFVESCVLEDVNDNILIAPTTEQLNAVGVNLAEDEYIKWYVLKDEADHWHIDGIITKIETETEPESTTEEPTRVEPTTEEPTTEEPSRVEPTTEGETEGETEPETEQQTEGDTEGETEPSSGEVLGTEEVNTKETEGETKKSEVLAAVETKKDETQGESEKNAGVLSAETTSVKTGDKAPVKSAGIALLLSGAAILITLRKKAK